MVGDRYFSRVDLPRQYGISEWRFIRRCWLSLEYFGICVCMSLVVCDDNLSMPRQTGVGLHEQEAASVQALFSLPNCIRQS